MAPFLDMRIRIQIGFLLLSTSVLSLLTGCSPSYTTASATATNQVTGVFGFVLGGKFTNQADWTQHKDGGYSYSDLFNEGTRKLPQLAQGEGLQTVMASADESGRIYRVDISVRSDGANNLFDALRKALAEKYPLYRKLVLSRTDLDFEKISFGNDQIGRAHV